MPDFPEISGFREISIRYEEDTHVYHAEPDCKSRTVQRASPDDKGVLRYLTEKPEHMTDSDVSTYCTYDWKKEREALALAGQAQTRSK